MKVVFYMNCQFRGIQYFLDIYYQDSGVDVTFEHIENFTLIQEQGAIDYEALHGADIFIYQPIAARHGVYSTSSEVSGNILSHLKSEAQVVSIPYIYNSALWCLIPPAKIDNLIGDYGLPDEYLNREVLDCLFDRGLGVKEVLKLFKRGEIDFLYEQRFKASLLILRAKEAACSVKVADFIEANVRTQRLFFTQNHPSTCMFVHCVNQILSKLEIAFSFEENAYPENIAEFSSGWPYSSSDLNYWDFDYPIKGVDDAFYRKHISRVFESHKRRRVYPLSYSIPEECFVDAEVKDRGVFSSLIPGLASTYIYPDQQSYYAMYQKSMFGFTYRKGGWDCLKHYEIIANKCFPFFIGLESCPDSTMSNFPKDMILRCISELESGELTKEDYSSYLNSVFEYGKEHLTCRASALYVLEKMELISTRRGADELIALRVLVLNVGKLNYSRELLSIGLRQVLGNRFIDYPRNEYIYGGDGFSFTNVVDDVDVDRSEVKQQIKQGQFDLVIFASMELDMRLWHVPFLRFVRKYHGRDSIAFVFGGDRGIVSTSGVLGKYLDYGHCFVRELVDQAFPEDVLKWSEYVAFCREEWQPKIAKSEEMIRAGATVIAPDLVD
jgi:hypothetical protein